ncbi:hypothetical protein JQ616_02405 [Bradyrhizobium tropiciagri]|uniref:hypothetical protein n=1 Tax=Bradyrhizobium tropiciagri TaxID=312253 RepID=UPI001BA711B7|nr:hypothetical protein [Bradyrhizobium tropiciagri]MBR0893786.1 hypothetical protein [Bradyrhizobium tropiciagri]
MSAIRWIVPLSASVFVSGCGIVVPELQENPADKVAGQQLVQSIAYNVTCEVQDAIDKLYNNPDHPRKHTFLDTWGANIALSLQVEEKSSANPVVNWLPPSPASAVFNLGASGTLSADATRQDKLNSYFTVAQLRALGPCDPKTRPGGVLLMQSDLGLEEWLRANMTAADTGVILYALDYSDGPSKTNVLSHEIKFDITDTGNITPGWKLTRVSVNQSGNLFSATRDRTNDLTITLGPTLPTPKPKTDSNGKPVKDANGNVVMVTGRSPSSPAADAALASAIGLAVSNAVKTALQP